VEQFTAGLFTYALLTQTLWWATSASSLQNLKFQSLAGTVELAGISRQPQIRHEGFNSNGGGELGGIWWEFPADGAKRRRSGRE
jgi:hypothetical protein